MCLKVNAHTLNTSCVRHRLLLLLLIRPPSSCLSPLSPHHAILPPPGFLILFLSSISSHRPLLHPLFSLTFLFFFSFVPFSLLSLTVSSFCTICFFSSYPPPPPPSPIIPPKLSLSYHPSSLLFLHSTAYPPFFHFHYRAPPIFSPPPYSRSLLDLFSSHGSSSHPLFFSLLSSFSPLILSFLLFGVLLVKMGGPLECRGSCNLTSPAAAKCSCSRLGLANVL